MGKQLQWVYILRLFMVVREIEAKKILLEKIWQCFPLDSVISVELLTACTFFEKRVDSKKRFGIQRLISSC